MAHTTRLCPTLLAIVVSAGALTACGSDKPPVCDDVDALQTSVGNLKDVPIKDNGLNALSTDLTQVQKDVRQLGTDAKAEFGDEANKVKTAVASLQGSVTAAKSDPTASTLSAVGAAVRTVQSSLTALQDAVSNTC